MSWDNPRNLELKLSVSDRMKITNRRPLVGVAVIVVKDRRILLGKRKNAHGEGAWAFPGGHLEINESIEDCAQREVLEETGIKIKNLRTGPYTNDIFHQDNKHYITLFVVAEYDSGRLAVQEPDKCETWQWFEPTHLPQPLFLSIRNLLGQDARFLDQLGRSRND